MWEPVVHKAWPLLVAYSCLGQRIVFSITHGVLFRCICSPAADLVLDLRPLRLTVVGLNNSLDIVFGLGTPYWTEMPNLIHVKSFI